MNKNSFHCKKNIGDVSTVNAIEKFSELKGSIGIAHTRWATHGGVTKKNAHPHISNDNNFAIVHNGIITNYQSIREELQKKKIHFVSQTDTEIFVNLVQDFFQHYHDVEKSFLAAVKKLQGSYAIAMVSLYAPDIVYAVKKESPLIIGIGKEENYIASDINAFVKYTKKAVFIDDGEYVILTKDNYQIKK